MAILKAQNLFSSTLSTASLWVLIMSLSFSLASKTALADSETKAYIVFTDQPKGQQDLRDYAIQILSSVLGSQKAAEEALGYVYRHVGPGFSARLTPEQASRLIDHPGVLYVKESEVYEPKDPEVRLAVVPKWSSPINAATGFYDAFN